MDAVKTGEFLRALRKAKGLTQEEVAEKLFVSPKTVSRWESGSGIPDINIIQSVAEFYGVTVDELLSGERKTYDEETLSYETQKNKAEGRARLIKESAIEKYNLFFIIAASCFALCWLLAVIFRLVGYSALFIVFLISGAAIAAGFAFFGCYEAGRRFLSTGEGLSDEVVEGINAAKKEIRRKNLLLADIIAGAECVSFLANAFIGWNFTYSLSDAYGLYDYYLTSYAVADLRIIPNALFPACIAACYLLIRQHFAKTEYKGNLRDINNRFKKCVFICVLYAALFTVSAYIFTDNSLVALPAWLVGNMFLGEVYPYYVAGLIFFIIAVVLMVVYMRAQKLGFAIASYAAVIISSIFGAAYIYEYYHIHMATVNADAVIMLIFGAAFVAAVFFNKRKLKKMQNAE